MLPSAYQEFIYTRSYSRWLPEESRRETWDETVFRYRNFFCKRLKGKPNEGQFTEFLNAIQAVRNLEVMPSMRAMWTAGPALDADNVAGYNCAYTEAASLKDFAEILYILMNGTGIGVSVERQVIAGLPIVPAEIKPSQAYVEFEDSKAGWAEGFLLYLETLFNGFIPQVDLSHIRPKGARLRTFGGRACLTGDTIVYKDRKKSKEQNEITIKDLFNLQNSSGKWEHVPNHFKTIKLRSLNEETGEFFRNKVLTVVDNGIAEVYRIETQRGYCIRATANHRFMSDTGDYKEVATFKVGDLIAVNGQSEKLTGICVDCGTSISRRAKRCKPCADRQQQKADCLKTTARGRKECQSKRKYFCEICGIKDIELHIHHIDENPRNNVEENLQTLCESCHRKLHTKSRTFGSPYSCRYVSYDKIASIEAVGAEQVFDLQMEAPNHNFVANGFVSHNSGPEPLQDLLDFTARVVRGAAGRKLNSEEVSDIVCKIAEIVVVGGVRRSAVLLLTNPSDRRMVNFKQGEFWNQNPQRQLANISSCYTEKPSSIQFLEDFLTLMKNGNGERALVNRESLQRSRGENLAFGLNPCGEVILRPKQFCNLTEVVVRPDDTLDTLKEKVKLATILGTIQATLSDFKFLSSEWSKNTQEDRLLGVSLTGIMDHSSLPYWELNLEILRIYAREVNEEWSELLGINPAKAITCVKPSGTVSQLVDSSSGIHPRFSEYYIRRVRVATTDPLCKLLQNSDVPWNPEVGELSETCKTAVFEFPCKAPPEGFTTTDIPALEQLDIWYRFKRFYTDHNPSVTIFVKEYEWVAVGCWLYKHWDYLGGITLLPFSGGGYKLAPYEEISAEKFTELVESFPEIDFPQLSAYEYEDNTEGSREFACAGGACEV